MPDRNILITSLIMLFIPIAAFTDYPKISDKARNNANEIIESAKKAQTGDSYKEMANWVNENKEKILIKQTEILPVINYEKVNNNSLSKDAISVLFGNYRFRSEDIKESQVRFNKLMIFVSSSIPRQNLKQLMIQAKESGGVLVFRGMIKNSIRATAEYLADISKDNVAAIIDPRLFDLFKVEVVPTFIVLKYDYQSCDVNNCNFTPQHDRIIGNISLDYALEQIESKKGDAAITASLYLKKLQRGGSL